MAAIKYTNIKKKTKHQKTVTKRRVLITLILLYYECRNILAINKYCDS